MNLLSSPRLILTGVLAFLLLITPGGRCPRKGRAWTSVSIFNASSDPLHVKGVMIDIGQLTGIDVENGLAEYGKVMLYRNCEGVGDLEWKLMVLSLVPSSNSTSHDARINR